MSQVKSSVQRAIRSQLLDHYPALHEHIDQIMPKKEPLKIVKCHDHIEIISINSDLLFFRQREGPYLPSLHLLHQYPHILPHFQVDKGAIRFVLSGANIMCPGLTSPGGKMDDVDKDKPVAIMAEGKRHALGIGTTKMPTKEISRVNKGIGVEIVHFLGDGLWLMERLEQR